MRAYNRGVRDVTKVSLGEKAIPLHHKYADYAYPCTVLARDFSLSPFLLFVFTRTVPGV